MAALLFSFWGVSRGRRGRWTPSSRQRFDINFHGVGLFASVGRRDNQREREEVIWSLIPTSRRRRKAQSERFLSSFLFSFLFLVLHQRKHLPLHTTLSPHSHHTPTLFFNLTTRLYFDNGKEAYRRRRRCLQEELCLWTPFDGREGSLSFVSFFPPAFVSGRLSSSNNVSGTVFSMYYLFLPHSFVLYLSSYGFRAFFRCRVWRTHWTGIEFVIFPHDHPSLYIFVCVCSCVFPLSTLLTHTRILSTHVY